jgi:periplasmic protein TonB
VARAAGKLIERVDPVFPRDATVDQGTVKARLRIDAQGGVAGVDITESVPPRVFDRAVRSALSRWRFEATGEPFTANTELVFRR